jgi:hypothetical protein
MTQQQVDKAFALDQLFSEFEHIAIGMGGTATRTEESVEYPSAMIATARREPTIALRVEMANGLQVDLVPTWPLSAPVMLGVSVRRSYDGAEKSGGSQFSFVQGEWRPNISEDTIRTCLTLEGPLPAQY